MNEIDWYLTDLYVSTTFPDPSFARYRLATIGEHGRRFGAKEWPRLQRLPRGLTFARKFYGRSLLVDGKYGTYTNEKHFIGECCPDSDNKRWYPFKSDSFRDSDREYRCGSPYPKDPIYKQYVAWAQEKRKPKVYADTWFGRQIVSMGYTNEKSQEYGERERVVRGKMSDETRMLMLDC